MTPSIIPITKCIDNIEDKNKLNERSVVPENNVSRVTLNAPNTKLNMQLSIEDRIILNLEIFL